MRVRLVAEPPGSAQIVVAGCFQGEPASAERLPEEIAEAFRQAAARVGFEGRPGQTAAALAAGPERPLVSLRGLGPRATFDRHAVARFLAEALAEARSSGLSRSTVLLPEHPACAGVEAAVQAFRLAALTDYRFTRATGPRRLELEEVCLLPPGGGIAEWEQGEGMGRAMAEAVQWARELGNTPPNEADPAWLAEQAIALGSRHGMEVRVLTPSDLERKGMGGLLAVGGGSSRQPRLVRLEWGEGEEAISIVGKGVTFDTGGISLKPPKEMDEMKFDKCGATAALGIARGAAELQLPFRFRVYLPLAENMPDGGAYRPGDIVRCYNGKTVEILNTDAEGRMILADALAWAAEEKPDLLLDIATLTGACVVALGLYGAGLFCADDELARELLDAGEGSAERLWRLPLWPEFGREMVGRQADLRNTGSRWGGANSAAAFLSNFVEGAGRWAHLDIAGTAWVGSGQNGDFGASGFGVALALTWLLRRAGRVTTPS